MIGQVDQEKTSLLLLTENFYRGYLLQNGQKYQRRELSFPRIKVKIQVELGHIHLCRELKRLNRQQLHQMLKQRRIRKTREAIQTYKV